MAKSSGVWVDQLVSLLGLDAETVRTQVVPFLDSFDDELLLKSHLEGLVGTESKAAKSFVRDFTRSRFPFSQVPSGPVEASEPVVHAPTVRSDNGSASPAKRKGKKTLAERAGIGQPLPPRPVERSPQMDQLASQFSSMGTVHRRDDRDEDAFFAGFSKSKKGKEVHRSRDQVANGQSPSQPPSRPRSPAMSMQTEHTAASNDSASTSTQNKKPPPPTTEMLAIDAVMQELTSTPSLTVDGSAPSILKICFCQGRKHPLAPYAPLCYSCGLIICSTVVPSPLSPLSSCPSCGTSPLLSAPARADLLSRLADERQTLYEQQLTQIQVLRDLKKANKQTGTMTAEEKQNGVFPKLGDQMALAPLGQSSQQQPAHIPAFGKHGALKKAQAMANDAERTAKVLSLDMKTRKVTQARPKPKPTPAAKMTSPVPRVETVPENNPYVGLDGTPLVRNSQDDVFAPGSPAAEQESVPKQNFKTFQTREWLLDGKPLLVKAV